MDLIYDPSRPNAQLVTDSMVIRAGQRFTVPDARGRSLLAQLYPEVREAPGQEVSKFGNSATRKLDRAPVPGSAAGTILNPTTVSFKRPAT